MIRVEEDRECAAQALGEELIAAEVAGTEHVALDAPEDLAALEVAAHYEYHSFGGLLLSLSD